MAGGYPCCCTTPPPDCTVCSDNFDRSDGTDIDTGSTCGWTETAGSWSISSNRLSIGSTNAVALCDTPSPASARAITVKVRSSNSNNQARVYVGYSSGSSYWAVQVRFNSTTGSVSIVEDGIAVAASEANLVLSTGTDYTLNVCYDGTYLSASISGQAGSYANWPATLATLDNGLGTGGTLTGTVAFDDWELRELTETCDCPVVPSTVSSCPGVCVDDEASTSYQIEIDGVADDSCTCTQFNGVWILPGPPFERSGETSGCCSWDLPIGGSETCGGGEGPNIIRFSLCQDPVLFPGVTRLLVFLLSGAVFAHQFRTGVLITDPDKPAECLEWDPFDLSDGTSAGYCVDGGTCLVTSL